LKKEKQAMKGKADVLYRFHLPTILSVQTQYPATWDLTFCRRLAAHRLLILVLVLTMFLTINPALVKGDKCRATPVKVTEVKELGLSESDETKAVIEVKWCVNSALQPTHSAFNVTVEVTYADGAILLFDEQAESRARSTRIEVPALHLYRGKKPAIIREIKAFVTAELVD
jgi:hypothetical protein